MTPLHIVITERYEEMALLIISMSPKFDFSRDEDKTSLELAVDLGSYRITRHLLLNKLPNTPTNVITELSIKCTDKDIVKLLVIYYLEKIREFKCFINLNDHINIYTNH